jgi:hypothetical protein
MAAERPSSQVPLRAYLAAALGAGCSIGQSWLRHVPTPPSATWIARTAPARASSDAARALR